LTHLANKDSAVARALATLGGGLASRSEARFGASATCCARWQQTGRESREGGLWAAFGGTGLSLSPEPSVVRGSVGRRLVRAIPGGVGGEVVRRMGEKVDVGCRVDGGNMAGRLKAGWAPVRRLNEVRETMRFEAAHRGRVAG
jgi:hypothetical protein